MKLSMIIDLAGNLEARSRRMGQALAGLGNQGRQAMSMLQSSAARLGGAMNAMTGRYASAIAGMGVSYKATQAVMHAASLDQQLAKITRTAGVSRAAGESLRRELYELAQQTGQSVDELVNGFYSLLQSGQGWEEARGTIAAIAPAMAVTGASADTLASAMTVAGETFKFDLSDIKTAKLLLDQMTKAGDLGNAELEHLADIFSRVGGNARNAGASVVDILALIEQMSKVEKQPERLATLVDSTLRLWNNENYRKRAEEITGVKFFDEKGNRRNIFDILSEMSAKYGKFTTDEMRSKGLFDAFGQTDLDTQRGIAMLLQQGIPAAARKMAEEIRDSSGLIEKALPEAISNSVDQVGRLRAALGDAADAFARPINDAISGGIQWLLDDEKLDGKELLAGGAVAAGLGYGAMKLGGRALSRVGGSTVGKVLQNMGGLGKLPLPLPVYVVNSRMSLTNQELSKLTGGKVPAGTPGTAGPKGTAPAGTTPPKAAPVGKTGRILGMAGRAGAALAVVDGAVQLGDAVISGAPAEDIGGAAGSMAGGAAGAWAGASAGAALGSIVPVLGTAIGGALGAIIGSWGGSEAGEGLGRMITSAFNNRDQAVAIGEEVGKQAAGLAESVASFSKVEIEVKGPAETRIVKNPDYGDLDVLRAGLEANGISWMD